MPENNTVMLRCGGCLVLNRVPHEKILSGPVCGACGAELRFPHEPVDARNDSFDREVAYWPETLLVMFTSPTCLYCKIFEPLVKNLGKERAGKLKIIRVDCETQTELAQRSKIEKTPTFLVFRNGVETLRVDGPPKEKTDLVKWIDNLIGYSNY